jgi:hypothetical protein
MLGEWLYNSNDDDQAGDEDDSSFMLSYKTVILSYDDSIPILQEQLQDNGIDNSEINDKSIPILQDPLLEISVDNLCITVYGQ